MQMSCYLLFSKKLYLSCRENAEKHSVVNVSTHKSFINLTVKR